MLIETETTPNPATLKFLPGQQVMAAGTRDFASPEEAEASPLAEALFDTGEVTSVFFGRDFVSVTAAPGVDWSRAQAASGGGPARSFRQRRRRCSPAATRAASAVPRRADEVDDDPADAEIVAQIRELIETRVRPAVASDGGDIVYRGFRDGVVYLQMQGACSGCPCSTATLKHGIEGLLKHYVPEVTEVRAA